MSSKRILLILAAIVLAVVLFLNIKNKSKETSLTINNQEMRIEVAETNSKRSKGLSGRETLGDNQGMLFIFPAFGYHNFWMYEMKFPLDFVWIKNNQVVDITENVQNPSNNEIPATFTAITEFNKVLEINAGKVKEWNIKIGDKIWYNF